MRAVIYYESLKGNTRTTGEHIATALRAADVDVSVRPIDDVDLDELAEAQLVLFGTWVHGLRWIGVGPAGLAKIASFPVLGGAAAAVFCTYRWNPKRSLETLAAAVEARGGRVLEGASFQDSNLDRGIRDFVADLLVAAST